MMSALMRKHHNATARIDADALRFIVHPGMRAVQDAATRDMRETID